MIRPNELFSLKKNLNIESAKFVATQKIYKSCISLRIIEIKRFELNRIEIFKNKVQGPFKVMRSVIIGRIKCLVKSFFEPLFWPVLLEKLIPDGHVLPTGH